MADLFISHSHQDVQAARDLRSLLETAGYSCWMAPDDVTGATPWAEQILAAIDGSRVMIILLSQAANDSNHVSKEVGLALERDKALLPVRVEDVMPEGSLRYLLQLVQWVDAFPGPMRDHLAQVRRSVASVVPQAAPIGTSEAAGAATGEPVRSPGPDIAAAVVPPVVPPPGLIAPAALSHAAVGGGRPALGGWQNQRTLLAAAGILAIAVVAAAVLMAGGGSHPNATPAPGATTAVSLPASPTPTASPTPVPTPSSVATPAPETPVPATPSAAPAFPNLDEHHLLAHVPDAIRPTCIKADAPKVLTTAAIAIVDCYPRTADAPNFVRYASFPTLQALDSVFNADVTYAGNRASKTKLCNSAPYTGGVGPYQRGTATVGQLICYVDGAAAWIGWTYEPDLIWVGATRGDGNAHDLYSWWANSGGPI